MAQLSYFAREIRIAGLITIESFLSAILFSQVYSHTVATNPGMVYFIMAGLTMVVAFMFLVLLIMLLKHENMFGKINI